MPKLCNICGAVMDDNAMFCSNCGTKFEAPAPQAEPTPPPSYPPVQPQAQYIPNQTVNQQPPQYIPQQNYAPAQPPMQQMPISSQYVQQINVPIPQQSASQNVAQQNYAQTQQTETRYVAAPKSKGNSKKSEDKTKKKSNLFTVIILLMVIVGIVVGAVLLLPNILSGDKGGNATGGGTSSENYKPTTPTDVAEKIMKAYSEADAEAIFEHYFDHMFEDNASRAECIEELNAKLSLLTDVTYEIEGEYDLTDSELSEWQKNLSKIELEHGTFKFNEVTDYKKVSVTWNHWEYGSRITESLDLIFIKYDRKWIAVSGIIDIMDYVIINTPEGIVERACRASLSGNVDAIMNCNADFIWENDYHRQKAKEYLQGMFDSGEVKFIDFSISRTWLPYEEELIHLKEAFDKNYVSFNPDDLTEYIVVYLNVFAEYSGEETTQTVDVGCIKYKGEWKVIYGIFDYSYLDDPGVAVSSFWYAFEKCSAQKMLNYTPSFVWEDEGKTVQQAVDELQSELDFMNVTYLECTIDNVSAPNHSQLLIIEEMLNDYEKMYSGFNRDCISDLSVVTATVNMEIDGEKMDDNFVYVVVKYNGDWLLFEDIR